MAYPPTVGDRTPLLPIVIQRRDIAYAGVILWALVAIALKHFDNSILRNAALVLAIVLVLTATINSLRPQQEHI
ncbi:hypothetical protein [Nostoc commune]|uniref:hypothetical protein n=1 Tax=Nostoc commune TaxID=1178 RepID=UPI001E44A023|nr:hypothetical protein [Nostoc commune]